jgi:predicted PurR-regulated permease PerM
VDIHSISARAALRVTAIVFAVMIALRFLWFARAIFIVTFLGVLLGLALSRAVDLLEKARIRRGLGAPLVLLLLIAAAVGIGAMIGPSIRDQTRQLSTELPKALDSVEAWLNQTPAKALIQQPAAAPPAAPSGQQATQPAAKPASEPPAQPQQKPDEKQQQGGALTAQLTKEFRGATRFLFPIVSSVFGAIGGLVIVLFIAMYIAADPGLYRKGVIHLVPHRHRENASELLTTLRDTLRQWLVARLIAMVLIGLITGFALAALDVKAAAALGVLAGVLEFVPFFGPIASAVPAIGVALVDSPQKAIYVVFLYIVLQQLEGNVITPLLLEKRLDIPPVLTVVAVAALAMVFGVIGMLVAEPLLAAILVTTKMLYVNNVVGDDVTVGRRDD